MYLREVNVGDKVIVHVHNYFETLEFILDVKDVSIEGDLVYFKPVYEDGKVIDFSIHKKNNHLDVIVMKKGTIYTFKDVQIYNVGESDDRMHCCDGSYTSSENNRSSIRHIVNMPCAYKRRAHAGVVDAIVKDVSLAGFAILVNGKVNMLDDPSIFIEFPEGYPMKGTLQLDGEIVRIVHTEGDKDQDTCTNLVGFRVNGDNKKFRQWVMTLERERAANLSGKY